MLSGAGTTEETPPALETPLRAGGTGRSPTRFSPPPPPPAPASLPASHWLHLQEAGVQGTLGNVVHGVEPRSAAEQGRVRGDRMAVADTSAVRWGGEGPLCLPEGRRWPLLTPSGLL